LIRPLNPLTIGEIGGSLKEVRHGKTLNQLLEPLSVEINEDLFEPRYNVSPSSALSGVICNEDFEIIKIPLGISFRGQHLKHLNPL